MNLLHVELLNNKLQEFSVMCILDTHLSSLLGLIIRKNS